MPMQWQDVEIPLSGGVETKIEEKQVTPPKNLTVENAEFTTVGALKKRTGYDALSVEARTLVLEQSGLTDEFNIDAGEGLWARDNELIMADGEWIYSRNSATGKWVGKGRFTSIIPTVEQFSNISNAQDKVVYAEDEANGIGVLAWEQLDDGNVVYSIIDTNSCSAIASAKIPGFARNPRVAFIDDTTDAIVLMWKRFGGSPAIQSISIDTSNIDEWLESVPTVNNVVTDEETNGVFDFIANPNGQGFLAYINDSGTPGWNFVQITSAGVTTGSTLTSETSVSLAPGFGDIQPGTNTFCFAYQLTTNDIRAITIDIASMSIQMNPITIETPSGTAQLVNGAPYLCIYTSTADKFNVYMSFQQSTASVPNSNTGDVYVSKVTDLGGGSGSFLTVQDIVRNGWVRYRPFKYNGEIYVPVFFIEEHKVVSSFPIETTLQQTCFLYLHTEVEDETGSLFDAFMLMARFLPGILYDTVSTSIGGSGFQSLAGGKFRAGFVSSTRLSAIDPSNETADSGVYTEPNAVVLTLDFLNEQAYHAVQLGGSIYINGGMLFKYDGTDIQESGFVSYPEFVGTDPVAGGSIDPNKTYSYRAYWEHPDANGEIDRSTSAGVISVAMGSNTQVDFDFLTYGHTRRTFNDKKIRLALYRTEGDPTADNFFHRVSGLDPSESGDNGYLEVSPDTLVEGFSDALNDTDLVLREIDYQSFGELDNIAPPAPKILGVAKNRLWLAGGEVPEHEFWFSKPKRPGLPVQFNDALVGRVDRKGGEITGFVELNQNVILFKETKTFIITGEGPNEFGLGAFAEAVEVSSDVGCSSQKTIVQIPQGIMFFSNKGWYLLKNDLSLEYIGAAVEAFNGQTFKRAVIFPGKNQVLCLTSSGSTLIFDYLVREWAVWTNHTGEDAVVLNDTLHYLRSDGTVYRSNSSKYQDDTTKYVMKVETPWIRASTAQSLFRVKKIHILGTYRDAHKLSVSIDFDYDESATKTFSKDITTAPNIYQELVYMPQQKCQSVKFILEDGEAAGSVGGEQSMELTSLQLRLAGKSKGFTINSNKVVG